MNKSIYEMICDNIIDGTLRSDFSLPDESAGDSPVGFAPGALDGICMYHRAPSELDPAGAEQMANAVAAAADGNEQEADALFREWTKEYRVISYINDLQRFVIDHAQQLNAPNLHRTAFALIKNSACAECVKAGLALAELFRNADEGRRDIIRRLGLYDEFTVFSVWNMQKWESGNEEIFALAKKVRGWGRIHAVEQLEPVTEEIRHWLLTEGTVNDVMNAYSALTCWQKSFAKRTLFGHPTQEEFKGIITLIEGLLDEGPVEGISGLDNAKEILARVLEIAPEYELTDDDREVIRAIKEWAQ